MNKLLNYKEYLMENENFDLDDDYDSDYELDEDDELDEGKYGSGVLKAFKMDHHVVAYKRAKKIANNPHSSPPEKIKAKLKMQKHQYHINRIMNDDIERNDDDMIDEGAYNFFAGEHHTTAYQRAKNIARNPTKPAALRKQAKKIMAKHAYHIKRMMGDH